MKGKIGKVGALAFALGLLLFSSAAHAASAGLVFVNGVVTSSGGSADQGSGTLTKGVAAGTKQNLSVAFFRPATGGVFGEISTGWLPGQVTITNTDGSVVFSSASVATAGGYMWFPYSNFFHKVVAVTIHATVTYNGNANEQLTLTYVNIWGTPSVTVSLSHPVGIVNGVAAYHVDYYLNGSFNGTAFLQE